ncbi:hypothetical protein MTO96_008840 [Rhipicephalus appendiculatus]
MDDDALSEKGIGPPEPFGAGITTDSAVPEERGRFGSSIGRWYKRTARRTAAAVRRSLRNVTTRSSRAAATQRSAEAAISIARPSSLLRFCWLNGEGRSRRRPCIISELNHQRRSLSSIHHRATAKPSPGRLPIVASLIPQCHGHREVMMTGGSVEAPFLEEGATSATTTTTHSKRSVFVLGDQD